MCMSRSRTAVKRVNVFVFFCFMHLEKNELGALLHRRIWDGFLMDRVQLPRTFSFMCLVYGNEP